MMSSEDWGLSPAVGMIRVAPLAVIPVLLEEFGVSGQALLAKFGLSLELFERPERLIPFSLMGRLVDACVHATACPHFGLLIGQRGSLSTLGAIGFMARNAANVATALDDLVSNVDLHDRGATPLLEVSGDTCRLGYAIYDPAVSGAEQIYDGAMAIICNVMRALCGAQWAPDEVHLVRSAPADVVVYRRFFQAPVIFDRARCALVFRSSWLDKAIELPDPLLHRHFAEHIGVIRRHSRQEFRDAAYQALLMLMATQTCTLDLLSRHFSLHRRTLNRRLKDAGTSFRELYNDARHHTARQLLRDTSKPISTIAEFLGYSEATAFNRAFSHWEGVPPARWRRDALNRSG